MTRSSGVRRPSTSEGRWVSDPSYELMIYPITLGAGKRLFAEGAIPAAFKLTESSLTPNGVIIVNYERAGAIPSGAIAI